MFELLWSILSSDLLAVLFVYSFIVLVIAIPIAYLLNR